MLYKTSSWLPVDVSVEYERNHGVRQSYLIDGTPLTTVTAPRWPKYLDTMNSLHATNGYIISPELITSPYPLDLIPHLQPEIDKKISQVKAVSSVLPHATIVLGSATFGVNEKPRNSAIVIKGGDVKDVFHKQQGSSDEEKAVFGFEKSEAGTNALNRYHQVLICSDVIAAAWESNIASCKELKETVRDEARSNLELFISPKASSLIVMSCWGVQRQHHDKEPKTRDRMYEQQLEHKVGMIMKNCHNLQEVIVVDRAVPESGVEPYNSHFKRTK